MLLIAYVIAGICCCTLCGCFCLCCKKCFGKKVDPLNSDLTASGYFKKKNKGEDGDEYELESMSDYQTGGNDGPTMAKESKNQRDKDLRAAYSNPFKPDNILSNKKKEVGKKANRA